MNNYFKEKQKNRTSEKNLYIPINHAGLITPENKSYIFYNHSKKNPILELEDYVFLETSGLFVCGSTSFNNKNYRFLSHGNKSNIVKELTNKGVSFAEELGSVFDNSFSINLYINNNVLREKFHNLGNLFSYEDDLKSLDFSINKNFVNNKQRVFI